MQTIHFVCTNTGLQLVYTLLLKNPEQKCFVKIHVLCCLSTMSQILRPSVCVCVWCVRVRACMCAFNISINLMASVILGICFLMHTGETPARHQWSFAQD